MVYRLKTSIVFSMTLYFSNLWTPASLTGCTSFYFFYYIQNRGGEVNTILLECENHRGTPDETFCSVIVQF